MIGILAHRVFSPSQAVIVSVFSFIEKRKLLRIVIAFLALITLLTAEANE
jgi:uncharacterized membrane protein